MVDVAFTFNFTSLSIRFDFNCCRVEVQRKWVTWLSRDSSDNMAAATGRMALSGFLFAAGKLKAVVDHLRLMSHSDIKLLWKNRKGPRFNLSIPSTVYCYPVLFLMKWSISRFPISCSQFYRKALRRIWLSCYTSYVQKVTEKKKVASDLEKQCISFLVGNAHRRKHFNSCTEH